MIANALTENHVSLGRKPNNWPRQSNIAASTGTIGVREAVLQLEPAGGARAIALLRPRLPGATLNAVVLQPNQRVRLNLAGLTMQGVTFHAAVTDALGTIVRKSSESPPAYLVELLFSFKGIKEVEVPEERIRPA